MGIKDFCGDWQPICGFTLIYIWEVLGLRRAQVDSWIDYPRIMDWPSGKGIFIGAGS